MSTAILDDHILKGLSECFKSYLVDCCLPLVKRAIQPGKLFGKPYGKALPPAHSPGDCI